MFFSIEKKLEDGVILDNDIIKICEDGLRRHLLNIKDMKLRGIHNAQNACTAVAATMGLASVENQVEAIKTFAGVEHRLEFVREIDGVKWYNDSIGSSPTRTVAGLKSFEEDIVLIAGGYDKHLDYEPLANPIIENVSKLILMGQTAEKIQNVVLKNIKNSNKKLEIYRVNSLEEAVKKAREISNSKEVVLFSPASASFDMFKNFMERGEKFKELVNNYGKSKGDANV